MKNQENEMPFTSIKTALEYVGGFTSTSKMPCPSFSLPASACKTGSLLRKVKGSVCEKCYACKGCYVFPVVKNALALRLAAIEKPLWVDAMVYAITKKKLSFFRYHDSGDIQSVAHLEKIAEIAKRCPSVKFWLPTKENVFVQDFLANGNAFPENLTVRLSAPMIDSENIGTAMIARVLGVVVSSVSSKNEKANCRAFENGGACGECRKCWDKNVFEVVYLKH